MLRNEIKFLINLRQYYWFKERCQMYFVSDQNIQKQESYPVFSAYFDTPDFRFYRQKIEGEFDHQKIRIRLYSHTLEQQNFGFLEAKIKKDQEQEKVRIPIQFEKKLLNPDNWFDLQHPSIDKILAVSNQVHHLMNIYYEREAYEWSYTHHGLFRINFDRNLVALPRDQLFVDADVLEYYRMCPEHFIVLEVKSPTGELPQFIKNDLRVMGVEQKRISKYSEGINYLFANHESIGVSA